MVTELQVRRADGSFLKLRRVNTTNTDGVTFRVDDADSTPLEVYVPTAELEHVAAFIDVVLNGGD
jgi:hypothetical protein